MLNGLFGTETGGNTFVNVILLVVITYMLVCWSKRKVSTLVFFGSVSMCPFPAYLLYYIHVLAGTHS